MKYRIETFDENGFTVGEPITAGDTSARVPKAIRSLLALDPPVDAVELHYPDGSSSEYRKA